MTHRFIAAVAGSAGSHSPLKELFDHTPHDDVSFVILRHLPTGYRSQLEQILSRHSSLDIKEIKNGLIIRKDTIYLAPAGQYVTISHGVFSVLDRTGKSIQTADIFMRSLAEYAGRRAIGIVLSGTSSDGSDGARRISAAGGLMLAQNPASCEFPDMAKSAIGTGCVDHVSEAAGMPEIIQSYVTEMKSREGN